MCALCTAPGGALLPLITWGRWQGRGGVAEHLPTVHCNHAVVWGWARTPPPPCVHRQMLLAEGNLLTCSITNVSIYLCREPDSPVL